MLFVEVRGGSACCIYFSSSARVDSENACSWALVPSVFECQIDKLPQDGHLEYEEEDEEDDEDEDEEYEE